MIAWWQFIVFANAIITISFLAITVLIMTPLVRLGLVRQKKLATATAVLFFVIAVGRAMSALHLIILGGDGTVRVTFWWEGAWNVIIAAVAVYYLSLYRLFGQLFVGAPAFESLVSRQRDTELASLKRESQRRTAAEAERDTAAAMLETIVANNQAAIYVKDLEGRYLLANPQLVKIMGRPLHEFLGQTDEILDPELAPVWHANDLRAAQGAYVLEEWNDAFPDGRHYYESVKFPLYDKFGQLYATCGSSLDVTHERRATLAAEEARDVALAASAAKSTFLATMSHEIRTPMNAVIGMTDLLLDTELSDQQREFVDTVRTSGDSLLSVINDILDFSKIESGELRIESESFDLRAELEGCLDLVVGAANAKGLDLMCYVESNCPGRVDGDASRLRQIVLNLLSNAVKFTAAGEILMTVNSALTDAGRLDLTITVTDTGIGISASGVVNLFESFTQVDASTTRVYGGTGLGLAISQRLAQAMGGSVSVSSVPDLGSTFTVNVLLGVSADQSAVPSLAPAPELAGLSALLVDDNVTCLRILDLQLTSFGIHCTTVDNPLEALNLVRRGLSYDVALVDMRMPDMDGVQLTKALREVPGTANGPIILVTTVGLRPPGAADMFAALLAKPVKSAALRRALSVALNGAESPTSGVQREPTSTLSPAIRPLNILLAEDNLVNQRVAQLMLAKLGHQVTTVDNGLSAVERALDGSFDVILMDVQMPQLDGLDATRRIRAKLSAEQQPYVIAMTASALIEDRDACTAAGMESYLSKPVRAHDLERMLLQVSAAMSPPGAEAVPPSPDPAPAPPLGAKPAIDEDVLKQLIEQVGDDSGDLVHELIDSYLSDSENLMRQFSAVSRAGDATGLLKVAHTLRSTSAMLGATELVEQLRHSEHAARFEPDAMARCAGQVEREYARASRSLERLRANEPADTPTLA